MHNIEQPSLLSTEQEKNLPGKGKAALRKAHAVPETDMMEQYRRVKERYPNALLFFRFGDFYEMFYDDAALASRELDIALTSRPHGKGAPRVPMCGVPYHRLEFYMARLIEKGHRVAICEQLEESGKGRGLIQRDVIRVVTPGTFFESERQEGALAALLAEDVQVGLAFLHLATGEFQVIETSQEELPAVLSRLRPQEILLKAGEKLDTPPHYRPFVAEQPEKAFESEQALALLLEHFGHRNIEPLIVSAPLAAVAAGVLLGYVKETQMAFLPHLQAPKPYGNEAFVLLDAQTQRNLELVENIFQGGEEGTLFSVLNRTCTPMGRRRLRHWLLHPLRSVASIRERQDAVAELVAAHSLRTQLRQALAGVRDLQRLTSRISSAIANPRDLAALRASLAPLPKIAALLASARLPGRLCPGLDTLEDVHDEIQRILIEEPRITPREGGVIRAGVSEELDQLRALQTDGSGWLARYEQKERERTGIANLKVGFNKVFGYYIEVTQSNLRAVPSDYQRRQTLVKAERFTTHDLRQFEAQTLSAVERGKQLEYELFARLREATAAQAERLRRTAEGLSVLDGLASLAEVAAHRQWIRPHMTDDRCIAITEGRHPVVEALTGGFVPNDLYLNENQPFLILTGPNAAGKSTYARQAAVLVLLAQIGSFVPADKAAIGVVDRIFTRVGAADFLARGLSTFMLEMTETANILRHATDRSLVILDEVGRGTGTSDGQAIAQSVAEHLAQMIKAKTLFTTHYHQLANLAERIPYIANARLAVREDQDEVAFLYKVVPGAAQKSYGLYVAKLAGLPVSIVERAGELLAELETEKCTAGPGAVESFPADRPELEALVKRLLETDPLHTTPLAALTLLAELRRLAQEASGAAPSAAFKYGGVTPLRSKPRNP